MGNTRIASAVGLVLTVGAIAAVVSSVDKPGPGPRSIPPAPVVSQPAPTDSGFHVFVTGSYGNQSSAQLGNLRMEVRINGRTASRLNRAKCHGDWCARIKDYGPYTTRPTVYVRVTSNNAALPVSCTIRVNNEAQDHRSRPALGTAECRA